MFRHLTASTRSNRKAVRRRAVRRFPIEPVEAHHHPPLGRPPDDIADLEHRILQMGRDDLDVVLVERNELEEIHDETGAETIWWVGSDAPRLLQEPSHRRWRIAIGSLRPWRMRERLFWPVTEWAGPISAYLQPTRRTGQLAGTEPGSWRGWAASLQLELQRAVEQRRFRKRGICWSPASPADALDLGAATAELFL